MAQHNSDFVRVEGTSFVRAGSPYYFIGTNFWYGMNLGIEGEEGDRERLLRELDALQEMGITNLRIMAASEGPDSEPWRMSPSVQPEPSVYREEVLAGLDFLLDEMGKREMVAVVCLGNFWSWSGGMAQYVSWSQGSLIPYPPPAQGGSWATYQLYSSKFYTDGRALGWFEDYIRFLLSRTNTVNGLTYVEDPTIMAWELANEPRGILKKRAYRRWIAKTASLIKSMDPNHLITIGSEGYTPSRLAGNRFKKDHRIKGIDYATIHIWAQNWGWYDPMKPSSYSKALEKAKAYLRLHMEETKQLGMPLVLEEFGISRDGNNHSHNSTTSNRNQYYLDMFRLLENSVRGKNVLVGMNFWAWGGEGRPSSPKSVWKVGDEFTGDPPHEFQGWYSVYNTDSQEIKLIRESNQRLIQLQGE
ncbi:MAG: cellulase family glycosylhydrolase [Bacteroidota bacterium]